MRVIIVKHENCEQKYLFEVPNNHYLNAGDLVRVDTKKGKTFATCLCDSFDIENESEQFSAIVSAFSAVKPLAKVIGSYSYYEYPECRENKDNEEENN